MACTSHRTERASTLVEYVALGAAALLLLAGVATQLRRDGGDVGEAAGARVTAAVEGRAAPGATSATASSGAARVRPEIMSLTTTGSRRGASERRAGGGTLPARVSRNVLQTSTAIPDGPSVRAGTSSHTGTTGGIDWKLDATACALCIGAGFEHAIRAGASGGRDDTTAIGLSVEASSAAHAAIVAGGVQARASSMLGPAHVTATARAQALVGGDATATGRLRVSKARQELDVGGSAMAGAAARGSGTVGLSLFGIAMEQTAAAEGWAGAGARGALRVERTNSRLTWNVGWGGALGLGGALDWSGSIDVSQVPESHRKIARRTVSTAVAVITTPSKLGFLYELAH